MAGDLSGAVQIQARRAVKGSYTKLVHLSRLDLRNGTETGPVAAQGASQDLCLSTQACWPSMVESCAALFAMQHHSNKQDTGHSGTFLQLLVPHCLILEFSCRCWRGTECSQKG